jgi:TolB protein
VEPCRWTATGRQEAIWSPGGDLIAYVQAQERAIAAHAPGATISAEPLPAPASWIASRTLWVARPDGTGARRLTAAGTGVYAPQWSGDGSHLLYVRDNTLWLLDARHGSPVRVLGPLPPGWFPDNFGQMQYAEYWTWNRGVPSDRYWSAPGAPPITVFTAP